VSLTPLFFSLLEKPELRVIVVVAPVATELLAAEASGERKTAPTTTTATATAVSTVPLPLTGWVALFISVLPLLPPPAAPSADLRKLVFPPRLFPAGTNHNPPPPGLFRSQYPPVMASGSGKPPAGELSRTIAPLVGPDDERVFTDSGIEIERLYTEDDVAPGLEERLGRPGEPPFTRGIHEGMYRDRLWTMRQYAGFATPEDTNERYRYLIEHGSPGLSMAFALPTQLGRDSDDPLCRGEVGRTGVPIDTIEDMRICFEEIPLDQVSTSMTINAPAAILLLLYELVGEEQ